MAGMRFYKGEIAQAIVAKSNALGGTMTLDDLANYKGEWVEGATTNYHGYDVWELPPPSQAWNALEILNILEVCVPQWAPGQTLASLGPTSPLYWHLMIEAKKLGYADLTFYNADPDFENVPLDKLLSKSYAATLCHKVDPTHASATQAGPADIGGTIVMSTADRWGNMVAFVNSNWGGFGSGITVPGFGFLLHNRAQAVHARSDESRTSSSPQASVQHARIGICHEGRQAADDDRVDGRRHAGAGARANAGSHHRLRCEPAGCNGHGALPP
jgi:gamma-glutamyltranspeptidase/glutathione hydrolase